MAVYTEVTSWSELSNAVSAGTYDDFIVIKNNFGAGIGISTTINVNTNKTVTIVADGNRTINRGVFSSQFFDISGNGRLVLGGSSLYTGTLTLDGSGVGINAALVDVNGGSFTMHSGRITGTNKMTGHGGGVNVNGGTFTMTGGSITGNTVVMGNGGGVYITGGGTFNLNSPAAKSNISGNSATIGSGPQVYVNSGTFKENGVSQGSY
jgi:autotransporter-associated beta strand protein